MLVLSGARAVFCQPSAHGMKQQKSIVQTHMGGDKEDSHSEVSGIQDVCFLSEISADR